MYEGTVVKILGDVLGRSSTAINAGDELARDLGMDSLDRCEIQNELEDAAQREHLLSITITDADAASWRVVADVCSSYTEVLEATKCSVSTPARS